MIQQRLIGLLVFILYRLLYASWRVQFSEPPEFLDQLKKRKPLLLAHWHGDELSLIGFSRRYNIATITSHSKDGTIMDTVLRLLGAKTTRGSSSKGGASALKNLIRVVREHQRNCSFAVDGPRGPIYKVKPGVFEQSRLLNMDIFAIAASCDRAWYFPKSWNKSFLPKPFAKINVVVTPVRLALGRDEDPRDATIAEQLAIKIAQVKKESALEFDESLHLPG